MESTSASSHTTTGIFNYAGWCFIIRTDFILADKDSNRVVLNVGGKRFETLVDTLQKFPETMLGAMFSSKGVAVAIPDKNGEVCKSNLNLC